MGKYRKSKLKKYCKIQSPRPICVPRDYFMVDRFQVTWLGRHYKTYANKKVSEPTFLHQIKWCFGILFGLSAQVNMAFIFDINTNLNKNYKEMSQVDNWICGFHCPCCCRVHTCEPSGGSIFLPILRVPSVPPVNFQNLPPVMTKNAERYEW
jgi:hypothetical protein